MYYCMSLSIMKYTPKFIIHQILKDNTYDSLHLGRNYARIFVLGHFLFLEAHSFPRATFSQNCLLLGTDNVRGHVSKHIFAPNGGYCLYTCMLDLS